MCASTIEAPIVIAKPGYIVPGDQKVPQDNYVVF